MQQGGKMKKYKVWTATPKYFTDLTAATKYANDHFRKTGDIIAITEYVAKNSK